MSTLRTKSKFSGAVGACTVLAATGVGVAGLSVTPANAAIFGLTSIVDTQTHSFTGSALSVTDERGNATTTKTTTANTSSSNFAGTAVSTSLTGNYTAPAAFNKFNSANGYDGVLTNVIVKANDITRSGNNSVTIRGGSGNVTAVASGSNTANVLLPDGNTLAIPTMQGGNATSTRTTGSGNFSSGPAAFTNTTSSPTQTSGNLSTYSGNTGGDTVTLQPRATLTENVTTPSGIGSFVPANTTGTYNLAMSGNLSIQYDYYYHADPSFSASGGSISDTIGNVTYTGNKTSLVIDFGNVAQGENFGLVSSAFSIFNLSHNGNLSLAGNTIDLGLTAIGNGDVDPVCTANFWTCTDYSNLFTDVTPFDSGGSIFGSTELTAGNGYTYNAYFSTDQALGQYTSHWVFNLSDDVGGMGVAFAGDHTYQLDLYLVANIVGTTNVPEPVTSSMFGAGLAGLFFLRRRKKRGEKDELLAAAVQKAAA